MIQPYCVTGKYLSIPISGALPHMNRLIFAKSIIQSIKDSVTDQVKLGTHVRWKNYLYGEKRRKLFTLQLCIYLFLLY